MEAKFTKGPWVDGNVSDAIVSKLPIADDATESQMDAYRYYGGECICESVIPENKAIIKASPLLYEALEAVEWSGEETWDNVQEVFVGTCPDCGTLKGDRHHSECLLNTALRAARGEK